MKFYSTFSEKNFSNSRFFYIAAVWCLAAAAAAAAAAYNFKKIALWMQNFDTLYFVTRITVGWITFSREIQANIWKGR